MNTSPNINCDKNYYASLNFCMTLKIVHLYHNIIQKSASIFSLAKLYCSILLTQVKAQKAANKQ